jgi:hypothetical protein
MGYRWYVTTELTGSTAVGTIQYISMSVQADNRVLKLSSERNLGSRLKKGCLMF